MGSTLLPDLATEIFIPVCAVIGIAFALFQWLLVSKVKLTTARDASSDAAGKNGFNDYLIEEEEGINDHNVVQKCAEIQNAISEVNLDGKQNCSSARVPHFLDSLLPELQVPWTQVSRSRSLLLMVKPRVFLVAIGLGA